MAMAAPLPVSVAVGRASFKLSPQFSLCYACLPARKTLCGRRSALQLQGWGVAAKTGERDPVGEFKAQSLEGVG